MSCRPGLSASRNERTSAWPSWRPPSAPRPRGVMSHRLSVPREAAVVVARLIRRFGMKSIGVDLFHGNAAPRFRIERNLPLWRDRGPVGSERHAVVEENSAGFPLVDLGRRPLGLGRDRCVALLRRAIEHHRLSHFDNGLFAHFLHLAMDRLESPQAKCRSPVISTRRPVATTEPGSLCRYEGLRHSYERK